MKLYPRMETKKEKGHTELYRDMHDMIDGNRG